MRSRSTLRTGEGTLSELACSRVAVRSAVWRLCAKVLLVVGVGLSPCVLLAQVPKIADVPISLPELQRQRLTQAKESLIAYRSELVKKAEDHNRKCNAVAKDTPEWKSCSDEQSELEAQRQQYIDAVNSFNHEVEQGVSAQETRADSKPGPLIGGAAAVRGDVFWLTKAGQKVPIRSGSPMVLNEHVLTGPDGRLQVLLADETVFTLGPNSDMVLDEYVYDPKTSAGKILATIARGSFRFVTGKMAHQDPTSTRVKIAVGTIGIRGTDVETEISPDGSGHVKLFSGLVEITAKNTGTLIVLNPGEIVTFSANGTFDSVMKFP